MMFRIVPPVPVFVRDDAHTCAAPQGAAQYH
jgi:hypothetical protein